MQLKIIFFIILLSTSSVANYQKVKVGKIDSHYSSMLSRTQLKDIIYEIENTFESELNVNIFDYSKNGKPIDILYMPPSKIKKNIYRSMQKLKKDKLKIEYIQDTFLSKKEKIKSSQNIVKRENRLLNKDIRALNRYINEMNDKKITSKNEYSQIKSKIKNMKRNINSKKNRFLQKKTKLKSLLNSYNQKISRYNTLIKQYNRLQRKVEIMTRSSKEVKGAAIGRTKTEVQTFSIDGKEYRKKVKTSYMEKIEIYGFDNLSQLKAILAHEIAHLVGIRHVNVKGALMNPLLQKNQVNNLELTANDIDLFDEVF